MRHKSTICNRAAFEKPELPESHQGKTPLGRTRQGQIKIDIRRLIAEQKGHTQDDLHQNGTDRDRILDGRRTKMKSWMQTKQALMGKHAFVLWAGCFEKLRTP